MIDGIELAVADHQGLAGLDDRNAPRGQDISHTLEQAQGRRRVGDDVHGDDDVEPAIRLGVREKARENLVPGRGCDLVEIVGGIDARDVEPPVRQAGQVTAVVRRNLQNPRARPHAAAERRGEPGEIGGQRAAGAAGIEVVPEQAVGMEEMRELPVRAAGTNGEPERKRLKGLRGIAEQRVRQRLDAEIQERPGLGLAHDASRLLPERGGHDAFLSSGDRSDASSWAVKSAQRSARDTSPGAPQRAWMRAQFMRNE